MKTHVRPKTSIPGFLLAALVFLATALLVSRITTSLAAEKIAKLTPAAPSGPLKVELKFDSEYATPDTTYELRFPRPAIDPRLVGASPKDLPFSVTPALPGSFKWTSLRSGVFTPSQPLGIGRKYQFQATLKSVEETPADMILDTEVPGPLLTVNGANPNDFETNNAVATPAVQLLFNADVDAAAASKFISFVSVNDEGKPVGPAIPAVVTQATTAMSFPYYHSRSNSTLTWKQQFDEMQTSAQSENDEAEAAPAPAPAPSATPQPVPNRLFIKPQRPLDAGKTWNLTVAAGLPSPDSPLPLAEPYVLDIGTVLPFEVRSIAAENLLNRPKAISIVFTKAYDPEKFKALTPADVADISPAPADLKLVQPVNDLTTLLLVGSFEMDKPYSVSVKPGLPALEPFTLQSTPAAKSTVTFQRIPGRLYFPTFTAHQLSTGQREFRLLSLNLDQYRLQTKLLDRKSLVPMLVAYKEYYKDSSSADHDTEPYQSFVTFSEAAGTQIYDQTIPGPGLDDAAHDKTFAWDDLLAKRPAGPILLNAEATANGLDGKPRPVGAQAIVQLTDLGLIWKNSSDQVWIHAFSLATGKPVAGAALSITDDKGDNVAEGVTDAQGQVTLSRPSDCGATWILAQSGDDLHAEPYSATSENVSMYQFPVSYNPYGDAPDSRALIFSDRGVYLPGETAHLKAIVRQWADNALALPKERKGTLTLRNPRYDEVFSEEVTISDTGAVDKDIILPKSPLGEYTARIEVDGAEASVYFSIEEIKPNAFRVSMDETKTNAVGGSFSLPGEATYYLGAALNAAKVRWTLSAYDENPTFPGYDDWQFATEIYDAELGFEASALALQGEVKTAPDGKFTIQPPDLTFTSVAPKPRKCELIAEITDINQQTVSHSINFTRDSSDFYLGLRNPGELLAAGQPFPVQIAAVQPSGEPYSKPVTAKVRLRKIKWSTVNVQGAGESSEYKNTPEFIDVQSSDLATSQMEKRGLSWSPTKGQPVLMLTAPESGQYLLEITAQDAAGRLVATATTLDVEGAEKASEAIRSQVRMDIVPDKEAYRPGDTARILVKSPIQGEAIVTVEREKVIRSFSTQLTGEDSVVEVPVAPGDAPNVYVSVLVLRGANDSLRQIKSVQWRVGYCTLPVRDPSKKLNVAITPAAPDYRPREIVNATALVLDQDQKPVPNAEVTIYAVDEGVLSLTGYEISDPYAIFYQQRDLKVRLNTSLDSLISENPAELSYGNKGFVVGGGGKDMTDLVRSEFKATPFWSATARTDAEGKAPIAFAAPDNLTEFRLMAVAQTKDSAFGSGQGSVRINKPVMVTPALPRFANLGDRVIIRGVVYNQTEQPQTIELTVVPDDTIQPLSALADPPLAPAITAAGSPAPAPLVRTVDVPAGLTAAVDIPVEFVRTGEAVWTWRARAVAKGGASDASASFTDAVESRLNVGFPVPKLREVQYARLTDSEGDSTESVSPQVLAGTGSATLSVSSSRLLQLSDAIDYLLHYPYGCVEQTTSAMLPWLVLKENGNTLPLKNATPEKIKDAVDNGIRRLLSMQTGSGGLSYWPGGSEPMLWASAYGGFGMVMAQKQGFDVPTSAVDSLTSYLSKSLRDTADLDDRYDLSPRCLALLTLAMAGKAEPSYYEVLHAKRNLLDNEDRAVLALAILESAGPGKMVGELLQDPPSTKNPNNGYRSFSWFGSDERTDAIRLLAWSQYKPEDPKTTKLLDQLMGHRKTGRWINTQSNVWALMAVSAYSAATDGAAASRPDSSGVISLNKSATNFTLNKDRGWTEKTVDFSSATGGLTEAKVVNPAKVALYTRLLVDARPQVLDQPRQNQGFGISRTYEEVMSDGKLVPATDLEVGDRVLVTLKVNSPEIAAYVAIEDMLPSTLEAINPNFKTQRTAASDVTSYNWISDFQEMHEDRTVFFVNTLWPGTYTLTYLARVRASGTVRAPSAKIEEMYHPEVFGLSETTPFTTQAMK